MTAPKDFADLDLPKLTEKQFQGHITELAKLCHWWAYHTHDSRRSEAGFPDLVLVRGSWLVFAEIKVGDNKPTRKQLACLARLKATGANVFIWHPDDWPFIQELLQEGRMPCLTTSLKYAVPTAIRASE
jgi:hypothetical protein